MRRSDQILILSCYELGHQPLAAASALGFLRQAGFDAAALDLSVEAEGALRRREGLDRLRLAAISVPMHTALHVGLRAARELRELSPAAHICFYGLYATLNAEYLLDGPADSVVGGEFELPLVRLAQALERGDPPERVDGIHSKRRPAGPHLARLPFAVPHRAPLPPLDRYARLELQGETRKAAAVEASRGCLHLCRHCPIPPVYGGRFFVVPRETVLEDIGRLAAAGVRHITFADPDFFNGPGHSLAIVRAMHERFPELTFDLTTKVDKILEHRRHLDELVRCGCLFVVSAVESLSDTVLAHLDKGHTREQVFEALDLLRSAGIVLRPSFVAFTPWTTLRDYREILDWIGREGLVYHVDPVQLSIRLLVPPGSLLADLPAMRPWLGCLEPQRFSYAWRHPDPRMDRLHVEATRIVRQAAHDGEDASRTFSRLRDAASIAETGKAETGAGRLAPLRVGARAPRLTEPWFC